MARTAADLPAGIRVTDHISLGMLTAQFPMNLVEQVLSFTDRFNERERALPAHVMVYYTIALALSANVSTREVLRWLTEGARWLGDPTATSMPSKSGISQARTRLGAPPLKALYRAAVATAGTPGPWMSLDGTTLDIGNSVLNACDFLRPASARGVNATGAFPHLRVMGLLENGTRAICAARMGAYTIEEVRLAADVVPYLTGEMLCLNDRGLLSFDFRRQAAATGAALLWQAGTTCTLPLPKRFADGSYRSESRWNSFCTSADRTAIPVRMIQYTLPDISGGGGGERSRHAVLYARASRNAPDAAPCGSHPLLKTSRAICGRASLCWTNCPPRA